MNPSPSPSPNPNPNPISSPNPNQVRKLQEEQLYGAFSLAGAAASDAASCMPVGASVKKGAFGGAFDFAKRFKCECPKCIVPPAPEV